MAPLVADDWEVASLFAKAGLEPALIDASASISDFDQISDAIGATWL